MAKPKIIYFIAQSKPTNYDRQKGSLMNAAVCYRDLNNIKPEDKAEVCDGVAGVAIPLQYQDMPDAKSVLDAYNASAPKPSELTEAPVAQAVPVMAEE